MRQVFISCSRRDAVVADQIAGTLERAGFSVCIDTNKLRGDGSFAEQLEGEIARCDVFVVLLSSAAVEAVNVHRELYVVNKHEKPVLPVVLEQVDMGRLGATIAGLPRVDFRAGNDHQLADIIDGVHRAAAWDRRQYPQSSAALPVVRQIGRVLHGLGFVLSIGGMGYFVLSVTKHWNAPLGSGPPLQFPFAFALFFVGVVLVLVGQALRHAARSRAWW